MLTGSWTCSQSIRTAAEIPIEVDLVEDSPPPVYQQIAARAIELRERGLSDRRIGQEIGVDPKTVIKAIQWLEAQD
jgi:DNA-binding transcriptional regulator YhcF (GntR family)